MIEKAKRATEVKQLEGVYVYKLQVQGSTRIGNLSTSYYVLARSDKEACRVAKQMARKENGYKNVRVLEGVFVPAYNPLIAKDLLEAVLLNWREK